MTTHPLEQLATTIATRADGASEQSSYTAQLLSKSRAKIVEKFGEEAVETIIAATQGDKKAVISESADMLYHWLVMLHEQGIAPDDIWQELRIREQQSGLTEKASRS